MLDGAGTRLCVLVLGLGEIRVAGQFDLEFVIRDLGLELPDATLLPLEEEITGGRVPVAEPRDAVEADGAADHATGSVDVDTHDHIQELFARAVVGHVAEPKIALRDVAVLHHLVPVLLRDGEVGEAGSREQNGEHVPGGNSSRHGIAILPVGEDQDHLVSDIGQNLQYILS